MQNIVLALRLHMLLVDLFDSVLKMEILRSRDGHPSPQDIKTSLLTCVLLQAVYIGLRVPLLRSSVSSPCSQLTTRGHVNFYFSFQSQLEAQ